MDKFKPYNLKFMSMTACIYVSTIFLMNIDKSIVTLLGRKWKLWKGLKCASLLGGPFMEFQELSSTWTRTWTRWVSGRSYMEI